MEVSTRTESNVEIFALSGRLDAAAAPQLRSQLKGPLGQDHCRILFNLEAVEFIDSSGLAVFVNALQRARSQGGDVAVSSPSDAVRSILELTRLHRIMQVFPTETDAIADLDKSA